MNLTTDAKIFLGIIVGTIVLVVGAVFFLGRGGSSSTAPTKIDQSALVRADSWSIGSTAPKVTVVEFSDFQCPFCKQAQPTVESVLAKHSDNVKLVYRHYPLIQTHQFAMDAATAAEAAGKQGKFWQFHDVLFANQPDIVNPDSFKREKLIEYAKNIGLNIDQFVKDLDSDSIRQRVLTDRDDGNKVGINATPTFFVNGKKLEKGFIELEAAVESILKR